MAGLRSLLPSVLVLSNTFLPLEIVCFIQLAGGFDGMQNISQHISIN